MRTFPLALWASVSVSIAVASVACGSGDSGADGGTVGAVGGQAGKGGVGGAVGVAGKGGAAAGKGGASTAGAGGTKAGAGGSAAGSGGSAAGAGGSGIGGAAGSTGGSAGSTGGAAGSTGGSAGSTGGSAGSTGGSAGDAGAGGSGGGAAGKGGAPGVFEPLSTDPTSPIHNLPCAPGFGVDDAGVAYIVHGRTDSGVRVSRLENGAWKQLGDLVSDAGIEISAEHCPSLVVTKAGVVSVSFVQVVTIPVTGRENQPRVRRLSGTTWENVPVPTSEKLFGMQLGLDPDEKLLLAVSDLPLLQTTYMIGVSRLDGATWTNVGARFGSDTRKFWFDVSPEGKMAVSYTRTLPPFGAGVFAERFDGTAWGSLGGTIDATPNSSENVNVTDIDIAGEQVFISFTHDTIAHSRSWDGAKWNELGPGTDVAAQPDIALLGTTPVQLLLIGSIPYVRKLEGTTFTAPTKLPLLSVPLRLSVEKGQLYVAHALFSGGAYAAEAGRINLP